MHRSATLFLCFGLLAACGGNEPIRDLNVEGGGPDERGFVLNNPLAVPPTIALPVPTPGGTNRADPDRAALAQPDFTPSPRPIGTTIASAPDAAPATDNVGERVGLLDRLLNLRNPNQNCVFRTVGPNSEWRRICEPVDGEEVQEAAATPPETTSAPEENIGERVGLIERLFNRRNPEGGPQNCEFRTVGPDRDWRRVCEPVVAAPDTDANP